MAKKIMVFALGIYLTFFMIPVDYCTAKTASGKYKILVVSSYHREYDWSQDTNEGVCAAMLKFGYLDSKKQASEYTQKDYVESSKAIVKKLWMDAKRKSSKKEKEESSQKIAEIAREFKPDIILLGDDDAANFVGTKFLDSNIPVVFWGVNNTPVKYGLLNNEEKPGHNVTGIYQSGYYKESLELLKKIVPSIKTVAILSDDTSTGIDHVKAVESLAQKGELPVKLTGSIVTNNFTVFKNKTLELQKKVDAFFVAQYSALKDDKGNPVAAEEVANWYTGNINIPEAVEQRQFVKQGMLCGADDSGYNQGFDAIVIAHDILANGANPATYPPRAPKRGALMLNIQRAKKLGITVTDTMGTEEFVVKF